MRMWKKWMRAVAVWLVPAMLGCLVWQTKAEAAEYDGSRKGSITVELSDLGTEKAGVKFRLYRVSELDAEEELAKADFSSSGEMQELAKVLKERAEKSGAAFWEKETGADGVVIFSELEPDFYLVSQSGTAKYGTVTPFIVRIPYDGSDAPNYDVKTQPKAEKPDEDPPGEEPEKPKDSPKKPESAQTGDVSPLFLYLALAAVSLGVILLIILRFWKRKEKEER